MVAERVVFVVSYSSSDLISIVTFHATVMTSGSLTYLMGCGVASHDSNQVGYLSKSVMLTREWIHYKAQL